ncbi:UxaA family hydrolase [Algoriphagus halophilus]
MINKALCLDPTDNVGVALADLKIGDTFDLNGYKGNIISEVAAKHKFALKEFDSGEEVYMYGTIVGETTKSIQVGEAITLENIKHKIREFRDQGATYNWNKPNIENIKEKTFLGYQRSDGQVGTANYWLVLPMVFCENQCEITTRCL